MQEFNCFGPRRCRSYSPFSYAASVGEANLLLEALLHRAGISHAGLARHLNTAGVGLRLRYDHASVARWIRDHAIPREPVPAMICHIIGERLNLRLTPADIGMSRRSDEAGSSVDTAVEQAAALWQGQMRGRVAQSLTVGMQASAPVWEWQNPPDDHRLARAAVHRVDLVDVAALRSARHRFQYMYRRVGGGPVLARIVSVLDSRPAKTSGHDLGEEGTNLPASE
jgi:hypothetical protein